MAFAAIRRKSGGRFNPCNYDVSDVVSALVHGIQGLGEEELTAVADACSAFDWPVYRSPVWALDCVAQEAIRRWGSRAGRGWLCLGVGAVCLGALREALHSSCQGLGRAGIGCAGSCPAHACTSCACVLLPLGLCST